MIGRHFAIRCFGQAGRERTKRTQHQEEAHAGGLTEGGGDQGPFWREDNFNDVKHAFVGIDLGSTLRRSRQRPQGGREPFAKVTAFHLVKRPVDGPIGLWVRAVEIENDLLGRLDHLDTEGVEPLRVDTIRLDVIFEMILAILDARQDLAAENLRSVQQDLIEGSFQGVNAITIRQGDDAPGSQLRGTDLGIEVTGKMLRKARVANNDLECRFV